IRIPPTFPFGPESKNRALLSCRAGEGKQARQREIRGKIAERPFVSDPGDSDEHGIGQPCPGQLDHCCDGAIACESEKCGASKQVEPDFHGVSLAPVDGPFNASSMLHWGTCTRMMNRQRNGPSLGPGYCARPPRHTTFFFV